MLNGIKIPEPSPLTLLSGPSCTDKYKQPTRMQKTLPTQEIEHSLCTSIEKERYTLKLMTIKEDSILKR